MRCPDTESAVLAGMVLALLVTALDVLAVFAWAASELLTEPLNRLLAGMGWYPTSPLEVGLGAFLVMVMAVGVRCP